MTMPPEAQRVLELVPKPTLVEFLSCLDAESNEIDGSEGASILERLVQASVRELSPGLDPTMAWRSVIRAVHSKLAGSFPELWAIAQSLYRATRAWIKDGVERRLAALVEHGHLRRCTDPESGETVYLPTATAAQSAASPAVAH
jgi:hypothetical protein